MQHNIANSLSYAESLSWIAKLVFGKSETKKPDVVATSIESMMAVARGINSGGR
jgi:hypothetical protein